MLLYGQDAMEIIRKRVSVRTYDQNKPVEPKKRTRLEKLLEEKHAGPLGNYPRFRLLDLDELPREEWRQLGTYGVIRGTSLYLLGAVPDNHGSMEDLGYCKEKIILEATVLGLGTCWLAGTFRRSSFAKQMELSEEELLPAISPVGYPANRKRLLDRIMKAGASSHRRKSWQELFFHEDGCSPVTEADVGGYCHALEAVRLAPSATNRQPWRIIKDREGKFHLYLKENPLVNRAKGKIRIQGLDMGIAMLHFEVVAKDKGIDGTWFQVTERESEDSIPEMPGWYYLATWHENV